MRVLRSHFGAGRGDDGLGTQTENESRYDGLTGKARRAHSEVQTLLHTAEGKHIKQKWPKDKIDASFYLLT